MKKAIAIVLPLIAIVALLAILRTPDTDAAAMVEKYASSTSAFAENDTGMRVHYRDEGNPDGVPIVLIHGTASSLHTWEPLVAELGGEYRLITLTLPGHGLTGPHPQGDYSYAGLAEAIEAVLDELALEEFVLGGNSLGGWMTWRYALEHPARVKALLLLNAWGMPLRTGESEPASNIGFKILQSRFGSFLAEHYTPRFLVKKSVLQSVAVEDVVTEDSVDRYWQLLRYPGNRRAAGKRLRADREIHYADRISEISAPTLVIWGAEDQLIHASAAQTYDEPMPNADVVIYEGIGHLPMEEFPERTALDIDAFLERTVKRQTINGEIQ